MKMQKAIIGKKVGMTQIFDESGKVIPVTVIEAGPCVVTQKKTAEKWIEQTSEAYLKLVSCQTPASNDRIGGIITHGEHIE